MQHSEREQRRRPIRRAQRFIERGASDALATVERWSAPGDLPPELSGRILYSLAWASEVEVTKLSSRVVDLDGRALSSISRHLRR
jgi:hypothetical protein